MSPPQPDEHAPYYSRYTSLVQTEDIVRCLVKQATETASLLHSLPDSKGAHRYAEGKWSINQVVGHMIDAERIFAYRALRISRNDRLPLQGFEQDDYVLAGPFEHCSLRKLATEFSAVRMSNVFLFKSLQPEAWDRRGVASGTEVSVRALAWIIAGHELHHRAVLKDKYLAWRANR